jgi:hypothetical protein
MDSQRLASDMSAILSPSVFLALLRFDGVYLFGALLVEDVDDPFCLHFRKGGLLVKDVGAVEMVLLSLRFCYCKQSRCGGLVSIVSYSPCGPYIMKKFGKSLTVIPRWVETPFCLYSTETEGLVLRPARFEFVLQQPPTHHFVSRSIPPLPCTFIVRSPPVTAS